MSISSSTLPLENTLGMNSSDCLHFQNYVVNKKISLLGPNVNIMNELILVKMLHEVYFTILQALPISIVLKKLNKHKRFSIILEVLDVNSYDHL